jgi:branched-chain amino acid transport system substrate-binding protein
MLSGDGITSAEFATIGGDGVIGTLMSFGPDPLKNPTAAEVVKEFTAKNINPEAYTLYSYAAVQIFQQAAEEAKSVDTQKMADVMHSGKVFKTVLGDISYDKKGDRTTVDYVMYTWKKGADGKISYEQNP